MHLVVGYLNRCLIYFLNSNAVELSLKVLPLKIPNNKGENIFLVMG